ncbi:pentapeptide repeat-containing protein [Streptomyces diastatochromogenes]|uniref:pentapeptide repeat-containing protein n=1 Tax=Streptomyces diastatochromogenes TaxID=42236 RepID=UPI0036A59DA9
MAALIALLFNWVSVSQTRTELQISTQAQFTNRFNEAVTHLGSSSVDVRFGGIYALERIMQDSPRDQPRIIAVLSAYVRTHAPIPVNGLPRLKANEEPPPAGADVTAVADVLADRQPGQDGRTRIDWHKTDLRGLELESGDDPSVPRYLPFALADLSGADLQKANFHGVDLQRTYAPKANLAGATLVDVKLNGAFMSDANLSETWANGTSLRDAILPRATLADAQLYGVDFTGAYLFGADLAGAFLSLKHPDQDSDRETPTNMTSANLSTAVLIGADLIGTNLTGADLTYANLTRAHLGADGELPAAKLTRANLTDALLEDADLIGANLEGANLKDADLTGANLEGANLKNANFTGASLKGANLKGAITDRAIGLPPP